MRVGVIDSGCNNASFHRGVTGGAAMVSRDGEILRTPSTDTADSVGHGTRCCAVVMEAAPECTVVPVRVFGDRRASSPGALIRAINWCVDNSIRVVNVSLGTHRQDSALYLYAACERARRKGVVIVAATGWRTSSRPLPAAFDSVISVGTKNLRRPDLVRYITNSAVDCLVLSSARVVRIGGYESTHFGTSFAAPIVSAVVARLIERQPSLDVEGVRKQLSELGQPIPG